MPKPVDLKRILFLGDSFTLGWGVSESDTFVRRIQHLLESKNINSKIETINAGVNATGPAYDFVYLKKMGIKLKPDIVVMGFYVWQDILFDTYISEVVTSFDSQGSPDSVDSYNLYVDYSGVLRQKDLPVRLKIPLLRYSHVFSLFSNIISPLRAKSGSDFLPVLPSQLFLVCLFKKSCTSLDTAKEAVKETFLNTKKLLAENNIQFLVVMIPTEFQVYDDVDQKHAIPIPLSHSEKRYLHEYFGQWFAANNIPYLDLLPDFVIHSGSRAYFERDDHWNNTGHALAASAISNELSKVLLP